MNENLVKHLEKTKECDHSYWKDHYQKATDGENGLMQSISKVREGI